MKKRDFLKAKTVSIVTGTPLQGLNRSVLNMLCGGGGGGIDLSKIRGMVFHCDKVITKNACGVQY